MASDYAAPGATQVGSYFVQQYYQILQQRPDYTHQFYKDSSSITKVDGVTSQSAESMQQIHELIMSLNFTAIEIKTINSLASLSGGVLVVVSGFVKSKNFSGWRKFVQTFFLAPQEKGYFVLNDIFHFINEEAINEAPIVGVSEATHQQPAHISADNEFESGPTSSSPPPEEPQVPDYPLEVEAREYVNSVHIEGDDAAEDYSFQEHQQEHDPVPEPVEEEEEETPVEEPSAFLQTAEDTVQETFPSAEEPVGEAPKLTYASILRAPKGTSTPAVIVQPSFPKSAPFPKSASQPVVQQFNAAAPVMSEVIEDVPDEGLLHEEGFLDLSSSFSSGGSKSIYIRNLPSSISTLEVLEEFKNFGKVKPDGVFLRNRQDGNACYAFVEFEDAQSAQNAVKASPLKMAGRQVFIEMRKPYTSTTTRGGRRGGRGRGGRLGGRGSGRGINQDGGDNNRMRSNGFRT
ncbi:hypothetical protein M9H77_01274 [Catharanthus roseus]|uniref:Uncharacterized protein n=1 Tax=Catharanthus roseus TaxID=4058 RepID=A0ACC0C513_CATRO|nr:hypothetical protein M9H77_01274 [Catharanthus roseus]